MNKNIIIGIAAIIILVGVGVYFSKSSRTEMAKSDTVMQKEGSAMEQEKDKAVIENKKMSVGTYEVYSPEKIQNAKNGKVVLFFRAKWCPTCRALDADIHDHENAIPEHFTILDVDYDTYTDLKKKYGVTYQHTLIQVDQNGSVVKKWSGSPTLADIISKAI